jgi:hypothetical protein
LLQLVLIPDQGQIKKPYDINIIQSAEECISGIARQAQTEVENESSKPERQSILKLLFTLIV